MPKQRWCVNSAFRGGAVRLQLKRYESCQTRRPFIAGGFFVHATCLDRMNLIAGACRWPIGAWSESAAGKAQGRERQPPWPGQTLSTRASRQADRLCHHPLPRKMEKKVVNGATITTAGNGWLIIFSQQFNGTICSGGMDWCFRFLMRDCTMGFGSPAALRNIARA